jgi:hypothetical protein
MKGSGRIYRGGVKQNKCYIVSSSNKAPLITKLEIILIQLMFVLKEVKHD